MTWLAGLKMLGNFVLWCLAGYGAGTLYAQWRYRRRKNGAATPGVASDETIRKIVDVYEKASRVGANTGCYACRQPLGKNYKEWTEFTIRIFPYHNQTLCREQVKIMRGDVGERPTAPSKFVN